MDSSVAAAILLESDFNVTGFTFNLWDSKNRQAVASQTSEDSALQAEKVCRILGIEHRVLDFRQVFQDEVVKTFETAYLAGETPNPCVHCNSTIKWRAFSHEACNLGIEHIATGHYARLLKNPDGDVRLVGGVDRLKDQSYFLWKIPSALLKKTILPLGELTKSEVRNRAREMGLPTADRPESQEVCFLEGEDYRTWLESRHPELESGVYAGDFLDMEGYCLGRHAGFQLFTIGQHKGLGLGGGRKYFVIDIKPENRIVILGNYKNLERSEFTAVNVNRIRNVPLNGDRLFEVKIRYLDPGVPARAYLDDDGQRMVIHCERPVHAVAPGQSAVLYLDDEVIAGGIISAD